MGCNTSQELKTKEGSSAAINNGTEQNDENAVAEQNASNEEPEMTSPAVQPKCASNAVSNGAEAAAVANDELQINKTFTASLMLLHPNNNKNNLHQTTKTNAMANGGQKSPNNNNHTESLESSMNANNLKANNAAPAKENGNAVIVPNGHDDADAISANQKATIEMNGHDDDRPEKMHENGDGHPPEEEGK